MTLKDLGQELLAATGSREGVSIACGYFPAWKAAELYDTHGLHPAAVGVELDPQVLYFEQTVHKGLIRARAYGRPGRRAARRPAC